MTIDSNFISWDQPKTQLLLNPRSSGSEQQTLELLYKTYTDTFSEPHLWVASSGSSSSTAESTKLLALSFKSLLASAKSVNSFLRADQKDIWLRCLPTFHVGGLSIQSRAFLSQSPVFNLENWKTNLFLQAISENKVTLTSLVPTQVFDLVQAMLPAPPTLRAVIVGGASLSVSLYLEARKLGWPLLPSFGMTEACSQVATASLESLQEMKYPSLRILPHLQCLADAEGQLRISGESMLSAYAQKQKSQCQLVFPLQCGWLQTQDLVELEAGCLRPLGRSTDYVKVLGEGVHLQALEQQLSDYLEQAPYGVESFAVIAIPNERNGHTLNLVIEDSKKIDAEKLKRELWSFQQSLPGYQRCQSLYFVPQIPRSSLGKVLRQHLLEQCQNSYANKVLNFSGI